MPIPPWPTRNSPAAWASGRMPAPSRTRVPAGWLEEDDELLTEMERPTIDFGDVGRHGGGQGTRSG